MTDSSSNAACSHDCEGSLDALDSHSLDSHALTRCRRAGLMESPRFIPVRKPYTPRRNDVDPYGAPPPRGVDVVSLLADVGGHSKPFRNIGDATHGLSRPRAPAARGPWALSARTKTGTHDNNLWVKKATPGTPNVAFGPSKLQRRCAVRGAWTRVNLG